MEHFGWRCRKGHEDEIGCIRKTREYTRGRGQCSVTNDTARCECKVCIAQDASRCELPGNRTYDTQTLKIVQILLHENFSCQCICVFAVPPASGRSIYHFKQLTVQPMQ